MKSQYQMIESIISKTVRQRIFDVAQPGKIMNLITLEVNRILADILDGALKSEQSQMLGRAAYERCNDKSPCRNGYKDMHIHGLTGRLTLRKPVIRRGTLRYPLLTALKTAGKSIIDVLAACFWLKGTSTRNTADILRNVYGAKISAQSISMVTNNLEPAIRAWENRPIPEDIVYLYLDALYLPVRWRAIGEHSGFIEKNALLAALGLNSKGETHILGFLLGDRENLDTWEGLLNDLKKRGLNPSALKLVISDEHKAITGAVSKVLGTPHQYCIFHKLQNIRYRIASPDRKAFLADFKAIYWAVSKEESLKACGVLEARWRARYPKAVELSLANYDSFSMFMNEPKSRWKALRTSNRIERFNAELRRRLRPAGTMHSELELMKICWSVSEQAQASWSRRKAFRIQENISKEEAA